MIDEAALDRAVRRCPHLIYYARKPALQTVTLDDIVAWNKSMVVWLYRQELESARHERVSVLDTRQGSGV
jgi:hypothetical protein